MTLTSTATPGTTANRLTRDQAKVLAHYAAGEASKSICVNTGFDMAFVGRVLDEHAGNDRARAHQLVLDYQEHVKAVAAAKGTSPAAAAAAVLPRTAAPAKPAAAATPAESAQPPAAAAADNAAEPEPATTKPDAPAEAGDEIGVLLDQADATGDARLQRAAAKVRELLDGLRTDLAEHLREARLRAEQAQLEARLAEIKGLLRPRRAQPPLSAATPAAPPAATTADSKAVRAWATKQGLDCPARGRIPGDVLAAYQRHQAGVVAEVKAAAR